MWNPMNLAGKVVIVTGASSGIGREVALTIGRLGAKVALVARNVDRLRDALSSMEGESHAIFSCDLGDLSSRGITDLVKDIRSKMGSIWGLVHAAGAHHTSLMRDETLEGVDNLMRINVYACLSLCKEIVKRTNISPEGGSVVGISSVAALCGSSGLVAYSCTKGALVSAFRSLAIEYAPRKVRFNCLCPGWVRTPLLDTIRKYYPTEEAFRKSIVDPHPLGLGEPIDVATMAAFLLSDCAKWITGTAIPVDGGYSAG